MQSFQVRKLTHGCRTEYPQGIPVAYPHPTHTLPAPTCNPPVLSRHPLYRPLYVLYPVPCCTSCRAVMYTGYRGRAVLCRTAAATAPAQSQCSVKDSSGRSMQPLPLDPDDSLPEPWIKVRTDGGDIYYWDTETNMTSWQRPT